MRAQSLDLLMTLSILHFIYKKTLETNEKSMTIYRRLLLKVYTIPPIPPIPPIKQATNGDSTKGGIELSSDADKRPHYGVDARQPDFRYQLPQDSRLHLPQEDVHIASRHRLCPLPNRVFMLRCMVYNMANPRVSVPMLREWRSICLLRQWLHIHHGQMHW